jgi:alanine racemase
VNTRSVWAEIDLNAVAHNVRELRRVTRPAARLMAVVKADGYGHGAVQVARRALESGADWLGVARIAEAVQLRRAGLEAPILVFGRCPPERFEDLIEYRLAQSVFDPLTAEALSSRCLARGTLAEVHIKIDTGMGRLGFPVDALLATGKNRNRNARIVDRVRRLFRLRGIRIGGIFTHFAAADSPDRSYAERQLELFSELLEDLHKAGCEFPIRHAANSAAVIEMPQSHFDLVRPGIALYGLYPSETVNRDTVGLRPAMALKSRIIQLKSVPAGFKVSYGMTYQTPTAMHIATVGVGYADGLDRHLSSRGHMLVAGRRLPIAGRICMDLTMLAVADPAGIGATDEVVVFGRQNGAEIKVDELAAQLGTINYEIVTGIGSRVPRVYLN